MSVSKHLLATAVACFTFGFSTSPSAIAENSTPSSAVTIESVRVGFNGYYKLGKWTHVVVEIKRADSDGTPLRLEIGTLDPYGSLTTIQELPVDQSTGKQTRLEAYFRSGRLDSYLEIRVLAGDEVLDHRRLRPSDLDGAELREPIGKSETLLVTLGKPSGFTAAADADESTAATYAMFRNVKLAELDSPTQLPVDARGYEGVDTMVIAGEYNLDERRSSALQDWVWHGGRLIVAVGTEVENYQASAIASWIPVKAVDQIAFPDTRLSGLERFSRQGEKIIATSRVNAAKITLTEGRILVQGRRDEPLLVRVPYRFGQVTFLALDLNRPPLSMWKPLPFLCRGMIVDRKLDDDGKNALVAGGQLSHSGVTEMATQLHALMDHFPEVYRFSSWMVMGLLLAYLIAIGPIDYLLVHKLMKRPKLTWITFPSMVVAGAAAAVWGASRSNGTELLVNQFDVVDIDQQSQTVRTTSWMSPYSPENRRYDLMVKPLNSTWKGRSGQDGTQTENSQAKPLVSWSGMAETTFGGMYRKGGFEPGRTSYSYFDSAQGLKGFPISIWSSRVIVSRWTTHQEPLVESSLQSVGLNQLQGSMTHHLPVPIEQWIMAYGNRVFRPRASGNGFESFQIHPNRVWDPNGAGVHQRELRGFLTRTVKRKIVRSVGAGEDILTERAQYNSLNLDPVDFMRMLTFHDAAGGRKYTGLMNQSLRQLDFSSFLHLDRAVLFGKINVASAELQLDGTSVKPTNHVAFVRFLLPVERKEVIRDSLPKFTND